MLVLSKYSKDVLNFRILWLALRQIECEMRIISFAAIREYVKKHADADIPLRDWYKKTEQADWTCLTDMKQTFNSVDYVGNDRFVFNIKGNDYRLVAIVLFAAKKVFIRFIGTHKEYDDKDCSKA